MRIADLRGVNDRGMLRRRDAPACAASARAGCRDVFAILRLLDHQEHAAERMAQDDSAHGPRRSALKQLIPRPGISPAASSKERSGQSNERSAIANERSAIANETSEHRSE